MKRFKMLINALDRTAHIERELYGHFSEHLGRCIYGGIYVGDDPAIPNVNGIRTDVVEAFRNISLPVLRWPGGCFADEYHWKDGIGEKGSRKKMVNTNWGGVVEDNSFGTHEFMELCEQVGCEPYIAGNVGSGTVQELAEWVEYMTFDGVSPMAELRRSNGREQPWHLKSLGIGNENWGCGGSMNAEHYANLYKQFATFCKNYSGNELYKVACGPSGGDYGWTESIMQGIKSMYGWNANAISLHFYCVPDWGSKGFALEFDDKGYYDVICSAAQMDELITRHTQIMDRYDPENRIALFVDEWGTWFDVEPGTNPGFLYQQNTMRDAIVAALTLNIFNRHAGRVKMANLAQAVNVLQALILTEGEKMIKTPTYHVFDLYKAHQGADAVYCFSENAPLYEGTGVQMLSSSASVKDGVLTVTLANCSLSEDIETEIDICNFKAGETAARILNAEVHAHNDFGTPEAVKPESCRAELTGNTVRVKLPACSVVELTVK